MSDFNPYQAPSSELPDEPNPHGNPHAELASRWARLGASIIDSLISAALVFPIMYFTGYWDSLMSGSESLGQEVVLQAISIGIFLAIHGKLLARYGQTVGKKLLNIQAVSYTTGQVIPFGAMIGKRVLPVWLIALVPVVGPFIALIDVLFIFGRERRCLHDLIADTKVVKMESAPVVNQPTGD